MSIRHLCMLGLLVCGLGLNTAFAGNINLSGIGGAFTVPAKSLKELRWDTIERQQYDYSCGSAAVATYLTYHYERPTSESEVFQAMYAVGNQQKIQREGFSMLDMKNYLDGRGYNSDGFRMGLDKLAEIGVPAIALIDVNGYKHFVVIKGVEADRVVIGDPALGSIVVDRPLFESIWNGIVLASRDDMDTGKDYFNQARDWRLRTRAPINDRLDRGGLGVFLFGLPGRQELRF